VAFARPEDSLFRRLHRARSAFFDQVKKGQIDLIASHFALYALPVVERLRATPTVVHFHGPWSGESEAEGAASVNFKVKHYVENIVYSRAARFIVLSRSFQQKLVSQYGVSEQLVRIVPGGIDLDRFNIDLTRNEARERLGWPTDRPIILTVRRQVRRMGLEDLIDAAKLMIQKHPDLLLLIGGSGTIAGELKRRIVDLGLENHVRLLGRIDDADLAIAYRAADMSVVPSQLLEGFGLITLESLASGTPVYVTPVGGLPEIVQPFAPGCVFDGCSAAEIAAVLGEALDGARPVPTENACRQYASDNFSWSHVAQRVRNVYDEARS
jgi:glycogen(starch) synthase